MIAKLLSPTPTKTSLSQYFRSKRLQQFQSRLGNLQRPIRMLDLGGTQHFWDANHQIFSMENIHVMLLNLESYQTTSPNFMSVIGDVTDLSQYGDDSFDVAFSNSVIEHLFTRENQQKMASELRRVAKYYFVQTPNRYFMIEPHWMFPLFQFLPFRVKVWLTQRFSLGHHPKYPNKEDAENRIREVRLMTKREMKDLFPDGKLHLEKFFFFNKSLIVHNFPD